MALSDKIPVLQKINLDDVYNVFMGLDKRQQILAAVGAVLVLLLPFFLMILFFSSKLDEQKQTYDSYVTQASELMGVLTDYSHLQKSFDHEEEVLSKLGSDSLGTVLYNQAEEIGIAKSKVTLKTVNMAADPNSKFQEVGKEVTLQNVNLDEVMNLLDHLSKNEDLHLTVKKLTMKPDLNKKYLMHQVAFTITTVKPSK